LWRWALAKWLRHGGAAIWPPRKQTAPLYLGVWAVVSATLYFGFVRMGRSKESEAEQLRKRLYAEASLKNLLAYEKARLHEEEAAVAAVRGAAAPKGTTTGSSESGDEDKKKTAPDVQKMLSLLYDEVEAGAITAIGVDRNADWYHAAVELLKDRMEAELRETIDKTRMATGVPAPAGSRSVTWSSTPDQLASLEEFKDGDKLQSLVSTLDLQVVPAFGRELVPQQLAKEARELSKLVSTRRAAAVRRIWKIFRPLAKRWMAGTAILMVTEGMWGVL
jgi:hypothetical protein